MRELLWARAIYEEDEGCVYVSYSESDENGFRILYSEKLK
jgi:hypothetical protein